MSCTDRVQCGYAFSVDDLRREVRGRGLSALLPSNPCNPTGTLVHGEDLARWVAVAREEDVALRTRPRGGRDRSQTLRVSLRCLLLVVDLYAVHLLPFCVLFDFGRSKPDSGFSRPESRRARWRAGMTWDIKNQLDRTDSHRDDGMGCLAGSRSREYGFAGRQDLTAEVSKRLSWRSALYDELIVRRSRNRKGREIRRDVDDIVRQQVRDHHLHQRHV
jgi:hypothetical protein